MLDHNAHGGVAGKGWLTDQQLIEHASHRVDIAASIDGFASSLFRRKVLRGADHRPSERDSARRIRDRTRNPEVSDLDSTTACEHDVCRLDIAMNDAGRMAARERIEHARSQFKCSPRWYFPCLVQHTAKGA